MLEITDMLRLVSAGMFLALSVVALRRWRTHHEPAAGWLTGMFSLVWAIELCMLLGREDTGARLATLMTVAFPYALYRFGSSFEEPPAALTRGAGVVCGALALLGLVVPLVASGDIPVITRVYGLVLGVEWVVLAGFVTLRLARAGQSLPRVARRRTQMLAGASMTMVASLLLAVVLPPSQTPLAAMFVHAGVIASAWLFLAGFAPPQWLLRWWRTPDNLRLQETFTALATSESSVEILETLLPRLCALTGMQEVVLRDTEGRVLGYAARSGETPSSSPSTRVEVPVGVLEVHAGPYTPFFSSGEHALLSSVGSILSSSLERVLAHEETHRALQELSAAQRVAGLGSWQWDLRTGVVEYSSVMRELLEFGPEEEVSVAKYFERIHPEDRESSRARSVAGLAGPSAHESEHRVILPSGAMRWLHNRSESFADESGEVVSWVGTTMDVTERHQMAERLAHQATHDELTGLPNRVLLHSRLGEALERAREGGRRVAVLFIDMDRFKFVNDTLGHDAGDEVLTACAARLRRIAGSDRLVSRFGGDEFVILCEDVVGLAEVLSLAHAIHGVMHEPMYVHSSELVMSLSVGVYLVEDPSVDATMLLRDADAAMYRAKREGGGCEVVFERSMREDMLARFAIERDLRHAIEDNQLRLMYQPLVELREQRLVGVEALVRWEHPERGLIGPEEFIPIAEETGLIDALGAWVLEEACTQLARWNSRYSHTAPLRLAVNFSGLQVMQPHVHQHLDALLSRLDVDPSQLELEITESVLMRDAAESLTALHALKSLGVRISIDDFGTGYSSLSYLKRFPVDTLKIDRSFVQGLGDNPEDYAIASAVVSLAWALGLDTVAEGVEDEIRCGIVQQLGCSQGQGYYFGRPMGAEMISALLMDTCPQYPTLPAPIPAQLGRVRERVGSGT